MAAISGLRRSVSSSMVVSAGDAVGVGVGDVRRALWTRSIEALVVMHARQCRAEACLRQSFIDDILSSRHTSHGNVVFKTL